MIKPNRDPDYGYYNKGKVRDLISGCRLDSHTQHPPTETKLNPNFGRATIEMALNNIL